MTISVARAATVEVTPDRITIANETIGRTLSLEGGVCRTVRFTNVRGKTHLDVADGGPHLRLINGKEVPASALRVAGQITRTPPDGKGKEVAVTIPVACTQPAVIKAALHLRVSDGQHFMHKWCDVQSAVPVDAVVCLCVLVRADTPHAMFDHIYQSLKPDGVLVMDNRSVSNYAADHHRLEKLASQVYRKPQ